MSTDELVDIHGLRKRTLPEPVNVMLIQANVPTTLAQVPHTVPHIRRCGRAHAFNGRVLDARGLTSVSNGRSRARNTSIETEGYGGICDLMANHSMPTAVPVGLGCCRYHGSVDSVGKQRLPTATIDTGRRLVPWDAAKQVVESSARNLS